jgi:hypothetical protein
MERVIVLDNGAWYHLARHVHLAGDPIVYEVEYVYKKLRNNYDYNVLWV